VQTIFSLPFGMERNTPMPIWKLESRRFCSA
jgi:hypothetical protein